jgi:N-acetylmuramoyl-L-alanine amidase
LNALQQLIDCGIELGEISPDYSLIGHRQAKDTDCPGDQLYELITTWDHWTPVA